MALTADLWKIPEPRDLTDFRRRMWGDRTRSIVHFGRPNYQEPPPAPPPQAEAPTTPPPLSRERQQELADELEAARAQIAVWKAKYPELKRQSTVLIADIIRIVCGFYEIDDITLLSGRRDAKVVHPRQVCMYLARKHTQCSLEDIARRLKRDHATVLHGIAKITDMIAIEPGVAHSIDILGQHIEALKAPRQEAAG